jgi:hypothetical protein
VGVAVAVSVQDYLIDHDGVDWSATLAAWSWLLPPRLTLRLVNRLCDLFIIALDGSVQMLDVGGGSLKKLADNRDEFGRLIEEGDNANQWLAIPLVDELVASGLCLQRGQCYGFNVPPSWAESTRPKIVRSCRSRIIWVLTAPSTNSYRASRTARRSSPTWSTGPANKALQRTPLHGAAELGR